MMDGVAQVEQLSISIRWHVKNGFSSDNLNQAYLAKLRIGFVDSTDFLVTNNDDFCLLESALR